MTNSTDASLEQDYRAALHTHFRAHGADLLEELAKRGEVWGFTPPVLLEVNVAREPQKHGLEPEEVAAGLKVGDTLDQSNADLAKDLLPPEILKHYKNGDYANVIADWPIGLYMWPPDFKAASEKNAGQLDLNDNGTIIDFVQHRKGRNLGAVRQDPGVEDQAVGEVRDRCAGREPGRGRERVGAVHDAPAVGAARADVAELASASVALKLTDRLTVDVGARHVRQDSYTLVSQTPGACSNGSRNRNARSVSVAPVRPSTTKSTRGSIWPKRSSTPCTPKSGDADDQIAPMLEHARNAAIGAVALPIIAVVLMAIPGPPMIDETTSVLRVRNGGFDEAVLVDSNVILDVATEDPTWGGWSAQARPRVTPTRRFGKVSSGPENAPRDRTRSLVISPAPPRERHTPRAFRAARFTEPIWQLPLDGRRRRLRL